MKYILTLSLFLFGFIVSAQHHDHQARFGVRLGLNKSSNYGRQYEEWDKITPFENKLSFTGGIYVNSELTEHFWLKHEFMYVNKIYTYDTLGQALKVSQHYIDVYPLNATFHIKGFQIFGGPAFSLFLAQGKEYLDTLKKVKATTDISNRNIFEIGYITGIEYEFPFGLNLGIRYIKQFTSLFQTEKNGPRVDIFSQNLLFTVGYSLGKTHKTFKLEE
ncbi:MAG TPA: outer membrane beta-barrel protein [Cytophagaceae bacterium]|jgi:hypothetical protein